MWRVMTGHFCPYWIKLLAPLVAPTANTAHAIPWAEAVLAQCESASVVGGDLRLVSRASAGTTPVGLRGLAHVVHGL